MYRISHNQKEQLLNKVLGRLGETPNGKDAPKSRLLYFYQRIQNMPINSGLTPQEAKELRALLRAQKIRKKRNGKQKTA